MRIHVFACQPCDIYPHVTPISLPAQQGLRFYVVNKHVRENEGKPPLFYQGMLRFRGW